MLNCPKCCSCDITGPRYHKRLSGQESLRYSCSRCGYSEERPCADSGDGMGKVLLDINRICKEQSRRGPDTVE